MKGKLFVTLFIMFLSCGIISAQEMQKSELQQTAEEELAKSHPITARSTYVRAYEDYFANGKPKQGVECAVAASDLYCKASAYPEAFDLLLRVDQEITGKSGLDEKQKAALHYVVSKTRMQMYQNIYRPQSALEHIGAMERYAQKSGDESLVNDALYNKAIYYYNQGQNTKGNEVFEQMAAKLTASKEFDKVDKVYQTLIENSRKSGNATLLAQSYKKYVAWKDSTNAMKVADEIGALKKQIADNEESIAEKDSSLTTRWVIIITLCVVLIGLAAALVIGAIVLLRYILRNRKLKNNIKLANENNALKARFIGNISAQLDPTLRKLDASKPEVKALMDFSAHIQTLSELENTINEPVEMEEVQVAAFCEGLMDNIRNKVKADVTLTVNAPKMSVSINTAYVSHILLHLLSNAAEYTPVEGNIWLDYKKRGAHSHQFLVSNTGESIPEGKHEDIFKPFREICDLTMGDKLGLPICKQMALKMKGDLEIDPEFTKGTRFVLSLHS